MDLPAVLRLADEDIAANGLTERFRTEAADLFAGPYPTGADVITLSRILHDWNDDHCRRTLGHCFDALPAGGVLLISENDFSGKTVYSELYSLFMLLLCESGARERSESEHRALLDEVGFRNVELIRSDGPHDLIVARKP